MEEKTKKIGALILMLLLGGSLGYAVGFANGSFTALNWAVEKGMYFAELKGIKIDMNSEEIAHALEIYKNQINQCYPSNFSVKGGAG